MRLLATAAATILALLAAGCGGDDGVSPEGQGEQSGAAAETEAQQPAAGDVITIRMKAKRFEPAEATVDAGQTVRWVNDDPIEHDARAVGGAEFESELLGKGETYETTVDEAGTVTYVCTVHPGMSGTLHVTE